jgi:hypothetical protein
LVGYFAYALKGKLAPFKEDVSSNVRKEKLSPSCIYSVCYLSLGVTIGGSFPLGGFFNVTLPLIRIRGTKNVKA